MTEMVNSKIYWRKIVTLLLLLSCLVSTVTVISQVLEMFRRFKLGYGMTDEAYGISLAIDRAHNPQIGQTPLFSDVTSSILRLVNFNIRDYRVIGLLVLILVAITFYVVHTQRNYKIQRFVLKFLNFQIITFTILYLSTCFRYLLITPSYQWLVLVGTTFVVLLLVAEAYLIHVVSRHILLIIMAFFICIVCVGRPTSGVLIWGIANSYFLFIYKRRSAPRILQLNVYLLTFMTFYLLLNSGANVKYLSLYWQLRKIDPIGSTLILEVWDLFRSTMSVAMILLLSIWFSSKILSVKWYSNQQKLKLAPYPIIYLLSNLLILKFFPFRDVEHLAMLFTLLLIGIAYGLTFGFSVDYLLLFVCLSPILTQFGSNTNSAYLMPPFLLAGILFIFLSKEKVVEISAQMSSPKPHALTTACVWLGITLSLLFLQHSSKKITYEVELPINKVILDVQSTLFYSESKLKSINQFRFDAGMNGAYSGVRIMDFSFWHPGAILFLGAIPYPLSIADKTFERTLDAQADLVINQIKTGDKFSRTSMIIRTLASKPSNKCSMLTSKLSDQNLSRVLGARGFDPYVKDVSIYRSLPIDTTLYPYNIVLLLPCERN